MESDAATNEIAAGASAALSTFSRRHLLKLGAAGLVVAASACSDSDSTDEETSGTTSDDESNPEFITIVIGAGIAGLAAARLLRDVAYPAVVLEASSAIGGRVKTDRSLGFEFDLGASWIHGPDDNPITDLAEEAGMTVAELDPTDVVVFDVGGAEWDESELETAVEAYESMFEEVVEEGEPDVSFVEVLTQLRPDWNTSRLNNFVTSTYLTFDTGGLDQLSSALANEGETYGGDDVVISNGYDTIAEYLARGIDVRLNSPVRSISYDARGVRVTTDDATFRALTAIVAVPLGVLKARTIEFDPPLPQAHLDAIDAIGFNAINKFLFVWDQPFWEDTDYVGYTGSSTDLFSWFLNVNALHPGSNALMTFAYADQARAIESRSDAEVVALVMANLRDMYGSQIPDPSAWRRTAWTTDPNTRGAYSFAAAGMTMDDFDTVAEPIDRLYFAGEHTSREYFSTVHGAYLSGIRAAAAISER
jgi:monoamine oxidase